MSIKIDTLYNIQKNSAPKLAEMPYAKKFCDINMEERTVKVPEYLSVSKDHKAENLYFRVDRFHDYMDLATTTCIIQYENADGEPGIYIVPYYDITSFKGNIATGEVDKIVFPWCIDGLATAAAGTVRFAIQFYVINDVGTELVYSLNIRPATGKIMYGLDVQEGGLIGDYKIPANIEQILLQNIADLWDRDIYWIEYD